MKRTWFICLMIPLTLCLMASSAKAEKIVPPTEDFSKTENVENVTLNAPGSQSSAENASEEPEVIAKGLDGADTAWMLISSALVLMMTAPGLALFYGGLVRKKNILGVMMQCVFLMGLMSVVWALWGYSLAFGDDALGGFIGDGKYLFMQNVVPTYDTVAKAAIVPMAQDSGISPSLCTWFFR